MISSKPYSEKTISKPYSVRQSESPIQKIWELAFDNHNEMEMGLIINYYNKCSSKSGPDRSNSFRSAKTSGRYFDVKWLIISQNVSRSSSCVFVKVFWLTLIPDWSPPPDFSGIPRTSLDFYGLLLVFAEIMTDKVILDHKMPYLVNF